MAVNNKLRKLPVGAASKRYATNNARSNAPIEGIAKIILFSFKKIPFISFIYQKKSLYNKSFIYYCFSMTLLGRVTFEKIIKRGSRMKKIIIVASSLIVGAHAQETPINPAIQEEQDAEQENSLPSRSITINLSVANSHQAENNPCAPVIQAISQEQQKPAPQPLPAAPQAPEPSGLKKAAFVASMSYAAAKMAGIIDKIDVNKIFSIFRR